jgi:hypothetical protein
MSGWTTGVLISSYSFIVALLLQRHAVPVVTYSIYAFFLFPDPLFLMKACVSLLRTFFNEARPPSFKHCFSEPLQTRTVLPSYSHMLF